jgi:hypothetical protein
MTPAQRGISDWLQLVQAEYREMPGLHLTKPQVRRLWGLDAVTCDALLDALETTRFLKRTSRDGYVLARPSHESPSARRLSPCIAADGQVYLPEIRR